MIQGMDESTFADILSEERGTILDPTDEDERRRAGEYIAQYSPYIQCPRCSEWQLAARTHKKRHKESNGFLRGSTHQWRIVERWWYCRNCTARFEVSPTEKAQTSTKTEPTQSETPDEPSPPERYELTLMSSNPGRGLPVEGGEEGFLTESNTVYVDSASAKFRLPFNHTIPEGARVEIERDGDDVYCTVVE